MESWEFRDTHGIHNEDSGTNARHSTQKSDANTRLWGCHYWSQAWHLNCRKTRKKGPRPDNRSFSFANSNFHSPVLCLLIKMSIQLTHDYIKWNYVLNWLSRDVWSSRSLFKSSAPPYACKFEVAMLVLYFPAMSSFHFYQSSLHLIPMLVSFLCCSRKLWKYSLLRQ